MSAELKRALSNESVDDDIEPIEMKSPTPRSDDDFNDASVSELRERKLTKCNWYELVFTVLAGIIFLALHYVSSNVKNPLYIAFVFLSFGSYSVYKCRLYGYKLIANDWGLTLKNFGISFLCCLIISCLGIGVMIIFTTIYKTALPFHYDLILMFVLYPLWGIIQQFLIQALIACNLEKSGLNYYLVIFLTACSFNSADIIKVNA